MTRHTAGSRALPTASAAKAEAAAFALMGREFEKLLGELPCDGQPTHELAAELAAEIFKHRLTEAERWQFLDGSGWKPPVDSTPAHSESESSGELSDDIPF